VAVDEAQIDEFKRILGLEEEARETIEKYHVTNVFLKCAGDTKLHFMIPHKGVLKNFNQGRGGYHHIAFCAKDIDEAQRDLEKKGYALCIGMQKGSVNSSSISRSNIAGLNVGRSTTPMLTGPNRSRISTQRGSHVTQRSEASQPARRNPPDRR
jgi:hypothetical protein